MLISSCIKETRAFVIFQERRCWLEPSPTTLIVHLFECLARNWYKSLSEKVREWFVNFSSWPGRKTLLLLNCVSQDWMMTIDFAESMLRPSFSWTKSIRSARRVSSLAAVVIPKFNAPCWSCWISSTVSKRRKTSKWVWESGREIYWSLKKTVV